MSSSDPIQRFALEAREHPERAKLGLLAYDVLTRQAEGKLLFTAPDVVEAKAEQLGVTRESAESASGNLVAILARGASSDVERRLVAAFAVLGFRQQATTARDADGVVARFVRSADWLELATPYTIHPFVDALLDDAMCARVHRALADAVLDDSAPTKDARARNVVRLLALAESDTASALAERTRVAPRLSDPVAVAVLDAARPDERLATVSGARVEGLVERTRGGEARAVLRAVSGFALLAWLGRSALALVGVRRSAELSVVSGGLRVVRRTTLLGRTLREREEVLTRGSIELLAREARYPALASLVGVTALAIGVLVGALLVGDGIRSGHGALVASGALVVLFGAALDLVIGVARRGRRGEVAIEVHARGKRAVRLAGVPLERADAFLDALALPSAAD